MSTLEVFRQFGTDPSVVHAAQFAIMYTVSAFVVCACLWCALVLSERASARPMLQERHAAYSFARTLCGVLGLAVSLSMVVSLWTTGITMHPATAIACVGCAMLSLLTISSAAVRPQQMQNLEQQQDATTYPFPLRSDDSRGRKAA